MQSDHVPVPFGQLLVRARRAAGLTQEELAERAGVSWRAVSDLKRGARQTRRRDTLAMLADALGLAGAERQSFEQAARRTLPSSQVQAPAPGSEQLAATAPNSAPAPFAGPVEFTPLPAPQAHPTNLPVQVTSFIGREREIDEAGALLRGDRLVTLMGAGGVGKTRLALALAAEVLGTYSDGVWWVALAPLADPSLVVQTVAQVFGLREEPNRPLLITLLDQLKDRQVLLVLDNCEHLVGACADLTAALLSACRSVHILATSQEGLGVAGERLYRVPSLDAPPLTQPTTPAHLGEYAAVQLFVARAQERRVEFTLGKQNAGAVARMTLLQTGKS